MRIATNHGQHIRRRQFSYRLFERASRLVDVPALWWLRNIRTAIWLAAIACWLLNMRMDALLLFVVALIVQVAIFQVALLALLREDGER